MRSMLPWCLLAGVSTATLGFAPDAASGQRISSGSEARIVWAVIARELEDRKGRGICLDPTIAAPPSNYRVSLSKPIDPNPKSTQARQYERDSLIIRRGRGTIPSTSRRLNLDEIRSRFPKARVSHPGECDHYFLITRPIIANKRAFLGTFISHACGYSSKRASLVNRSGNWKVNIYEGFLATAGPPGCGQVPQPKNEQYQGLVIIS